MATLSQNTRRKGADMTAPPRTTSAIPPTRSDATALTARAVEFHWRRVLTMWIFAVQYILLICHMWPTLIPEASHGLVSFAQRDGLVSPALLTVLFLFGIGISWRGVRPRWWLLVMLSGQGLLASLAIAYALKNQATWTQVAGHGGLFFLCLFALLSMIQRERRGQWHIWRWRVETQAFLIPIIGATLLLYGAGLATRPDAGIAMFIRSQFGLPLIVILIGVFAAGGGVVIQNRISASRLFVALVPQAVYAFMAVSLLGSDNNVSLGGVIVHLLFTVTAMFVVLIQTKEYALAVVRERQQEAT